MPVLGRPSVSEAPMTATDSGRKNRSRSGTVGVQRAAADVEVAFRGGGRHAVDGGVRLLAAGHDPGRGSVW